MHAYARHVHPMHVYAAHAYVMHAHAVQAHAVQKQFYVGINSMPTATVVTKPVIADLGYMPIQLLGLPSRKNSY